MAGEIQELELDWLSISNLEDLESGAGDPCLMLVIQGPAIEGREVQPYLNGTFYVKAVFPAATWPQQPPSFEFTTKIWHPLVNPDTMQMCKEAIPELWLEQGYKPTQEQMTAMQGTEEAKVQPMLSAFRLLHELLSKVHERKDMTAVNTEAMQQLKEKDGSAFDAKAHEITVKFAS